MHSMKEACKLKAARKSEKVDVFSGRPMRTEMLRNLGKSYENSPARSPATGVAGGGVECGGRAQTETAPTIPKFTIDRVAGVKKLSRACYYKIHWLGWESRHDSWELLSRLSRDTSVQYMQGLLKEYNDAPHIAAAEESEVMRDTGVLKMNKN